MATVAKSTLRGYDDFLSNFEDAIERGGKRPENISIALIDIDLFGRINKEYGRASGDAIIHHLARVLQDTVEDAGRIFRYGGDAFMILFESQEKEQAFLLIEEARKRLDEPQSITVGSKALSLDVSISCGVAAYPDDGAKSNDVIRKCSEALYRAKISGRDKVSLAREEKMVTKTTYYTIGQLDGLHRLAKREGLNEATLLREALDDILRKYNS